MKVVITGGKRCIHQSLQDISLSHNPSLGASGVLGSAVYKAFKTSGQWDTIGLAHSRTGEGLLKLDLTIFEEVEKFLADLKVDCKLTCSLDTFLNAHFEYVGVIHCAAERRPDVVESVSVVHVFFLITLAYSSSEPR